MRVIAFAVCDKDYINPLRVMLKSFRSKNSIPFKVYKLGNFEIPDDLKLSNVEYIDFKPEKTVKFINDNFDKFNKDSFIGNLYNETKLINMFVHLEIEDMLIKEYDIVFKTDIDVVYLDNIDKSLINFYNSNKPVGLSQENRILDSKYILYDIFKNRYINFNTGYVMINSKYCNNIFDSIINAMNNIGFEKFKYLDQDAVNVVFNYNDTYNLYYEGLINANSEVSKIPLEIISLHYNVNEKPFADISVKHFFNIISIKTYHSYLKISELCNCDIDFLNKIKKHIDYIKINNESIIKLIKIRDKKSNIRKAIADKIIKKMECLKILS